jgi:hypothetical protein
MKSRLVIIAIPKQLLFGDVERDSLLKGKAIIL